MRTQDIFNEINAEKTTYTELQNLQPNIDDSQRILDDLNTTSKVGVWRLFVWIISTRIADLQNLFTQHKNVVEKRSRELVLGNLQWYQKIALEFQHGHALEFDQKTLQYEYLNEDINARIVKLASANDGVASEVILKVACLSGTTPVQLTTPELASLQTYLNRIRFAGVKIQAVSRPADLLKVNLKIYYDPLVMNSDGSLISDSGVFPAENAINDYLKNLPFDGVFSVTEMIDKIQLSDGVLNPLFVNAAAKYGSFAYSPITDYYNANAGYLQIDPSFPLSTSLTYVTQ